MGPQEGQRGGLQHWATAWVKSFNRTPLSRGSGPYFIFSPWFSAAPWPNEWGEVNSVSRNRLVCCISDKKPQSSGRMMMLWHGDVGCWATYLKAWSRSCGCVSSILNVSGPDSSRIWLEKECRYYPSQPLRDLIQTLQRSYQLVCTFPSSAFSLFKRKTNQLETEGNSYCKKKAKQQFLVSWEFSSLISWISWTLSSTNPWNLLSSHLSSHLSFFENLLQLLLKPSFFLSGWFTDLSSSSFHIFLVPGSSLVCWQVLPVLWYPLVPSLLVNWSSSQKIYHWRSLFPQYKRNSLSTRANRNFISVQSKETACPIMSLPIYNKCLISKKPCALYVLQGPSSIWRPAFHSHQSNTRT